MPLHPCGLLRVTLRRRTAVVLVQDVIDTCIRRSLRDRPAKASQQGLECGHVDEGGTRERAVRCRSLADATTWLLARFPIGCGRSAYGLAGRVSRSPERGARHRAVLQVPGVGRRQVVRGTSIALSASQQSDQTGHGVRSVRRCSREPRLRRTRDRLRATPKTVCSPTRRSHPMNRLKPRLPNYLWRDGRQPWGTADRRYSDQLRMPLREPQANPARRTAARRDATSSAVRLAALTVRCPCCCLPPAFVTPATTGRCRLHVTTESMRTGAHTVRQQPQRTDKTWDSREMNSDG